MFHNLYYYFLFLLLCACTPEFNWREVHNDNYSMMFPAKPSLEQKKVFIENSQYTLQMQATSLMDSKLLFANAYIESKGYNKNLILQRKLQKQWCINPVEFSNQILKCDFGKRFGYSKWIVDHNNIYQLSVIQDKDYLNISLKENIELFFNSFKYLKENIILCTNNTTKIYYCL